MHLDNVPQRGDVTECGLCVVACDALGSDEVLKDSGLVVEVSVDIADKRLSQRLLAHPAHQPLRLLQACISPFGPFVSHELAAAGNTAAVVAHRGWVRKNYKNHNVFILC